MRQDPRARFGDQIRRVNHLNLQGNFLTDALTKTDLLDLPDFL
jgi:hypothetical protein